MRRGAINFPDSLVNAIKRGDFVVFAGAGVSRGEPASLPDFPELVRLVATGAELTPHENEPEDRYLGRLCHSKVDVHARTARLLTREGLSCNPLHRDLLRLFSAAPQVKVVTTNFDLLFEQAAEGAFGKIPVIYRAPALPRGRDFEGIIHVHGSVEFPSDMVLTDADFGRAYLSEGWARRFLLDVFRSHTVLFVGYSHNDVVMHYLARAIPEHEAGRRFALTAEGDDPQRWNLLGIEPILYPLPERADHSALYEGIELLAKSVTRNILDWKQSLATSAEKPPPIDSEAGDEILYALQEVSTARIFAEHARAPEWLSWLDSHHVLDGLFEADELSERDQVLSGWLAEHYATPYANDLFLLVAKHNMRINPQFWWAIGREIGIGDKYPLEESTLSRWVSLLIATAPESRDSAIFHWLGERCGKMEVGSSLLEVFDEISKSRLQLKPALVWPGESDE